MTRSTALSPPEQPPAAQRSGRGLSRAVRLGGIGRHGWTGLLLRRLLLLPLTLFLVATLTFFLTRVVGGNPAVRLAGAQPTLESIRAIEQELGLDQPLGNQYADYLLGLAQGDLGTSYFTKQSVWTEITSRAPATIELVVLGSLLAVVLGVSLGVLAARRHRRLPDHATQAFSVLAFSTPDFWLGGILVYFFFFRTGWLPGPEGQLPFAILPPEKVTGFLLVDSALDGRWDALGAYLKQLVLPVATLGLIYFASVYKITRASTLEVLHSDFLLYAEACGLRRSLEWRYALRHSLSLVVTYLGIIVAALIGGAVLVERVFSWGGLGEYGVEAIVNNDYPAVQGFVIAAGAIAVAVYFVVDLLYAAIDPRVRL